MAPGRPEPPLAIITRSLVNGSFAPRLLVAAVNLKQSYTVRRWTAGSCTNPTFATAPGTDKKRQGMPTLKNPPDSSPVGRVCA